MRSLRFYSPKGGQGTTTVAAGAALAAAVSGSRTHLQLVPGSDLPNVLGLLGPDAGGDTYLLDGMLSVGFEVPYDTDLLVLDTTWGTAGERSTTAMGEPMTDSPTHVGCYEGPHAPMTGRWVCADDCPHPDHTQHQDILVVRNCYLALHRVMTEGPRADAMVVVEEKGRAFSARDVIEVLDLPVLATIPIDPAIARVVDAGLLAARPPRVLIDPFRSPSLH